MAHHHRHHGIMAALTLVPLELHQHHLILQIIQLNPQTETMVLRGGKGLDGYSTYTGNATPLTTCVQEASIGACDQIHAL